MPAGIFDLPNICSYRQLSAWTAGSLGFLQVWHHGKSHEVTRYLIKPPHFILACLRTGRLHEH